MRWIHLSDFHTGKDDYAVRKLFKYILKHMSDQKQKGFIPDVIFITGDIAQSGEEKQYDTFIEEFLLKIVDIYDELPLIFVVPGNHDLDREKNKLVEKSLYGILDEQPQFFDTNEKGLELRKEIFNRFIGFYENDMGELVYPVKEIFEETAFYTCILKMHSKKVGIVGVNTAWLCMSDKDKEKLTPGKYVVEEALEKIKDCDYKFVLGHHPLSWYEAKQRQQISKLLADNGVIYLHGHMHKNSSEYALCVDRGFWSIQSGAAFQARENEIYYNSLLWGELDMGTDVIRLFPRRWSLKEQNFVLDAAEHLPEAFRKEGTDYWELPLEGVFPQNSEKKKRSMKKSIKIPNGWRIISKEFLEKEKETTVDEENILKFFDGKEPSYAELLSQKIPIREIAVKTKEEFEKAQKENIMKCKIIIGAGGEGKTTVMLQTVLCLVEQSGFQGIVMRQPESDTLHENIIREVTQEGSWIIAVDHGQVMIDNIHNLIMEFNNVGKANVHFLICMRDIDWSNCNTQHFKWESLPGYSREKICGISERDAEIFIHAWTEFGDRGLGKLKGLDREAAKMRLLAASCSEEQKDPEEGALLGAMLLTRYGDELQNHVRKILQRLMKIKLYNETLLDAFAFIVAMHSEKMDILSKDILAEYYGCRGSEVKRYILGPLASEAVCALNGDRILTRHFTIAKCARELLNSEFFYDFDELYLSLTAIVVQMKKNNRFVERYSKWKYISDHFVQKKKYSLAIKLDLEVLKQDPTDDYMMVHLSRLLRNAKQSDMALKMFRQIDWKISRRPVFCEWALVEALEDNKMVSVCLSAIALSDQIERMLIDVKNACMNLYSISVTFMELYNKYKDRIYFNAAHAAAYICGIIDPVNRNLKELLQANVYPYKMEEYSPQNAELQEHLTKGILKAASQREYTFKDWMLDIEILKYQGLFNLMDRLR